MFERCISCRCSFPICHGQLDPRQCGLPPELLHKRSAWESSQRGWPGPVELEPLEPREAAAPTWPAAGPEMRGCCG
jgi:hypothetical protein